MSAEVRPLHLLPDLERHGVVRHARDIAEACGCPVATDAPLAGQPLHLHFTERLWGSTPEAAAARVSELAQRHPLSVTLHDLPQASDGPASQRRRAAAYAQVVTVARAVACNSFWEADLLAALDVASSAPQIIPLAVQPLWAPPPDTVGPPEPPTIGLLGYVYPGKGHREAIDAAAVCSAALGTSVHVVALGAVSEGHAADIQALHAGARRQGVSFSVTGFLPHAQLMRSARQVGVPLAAHQHVSASGSIGSWLTAGRRPLVVDSRYAREIDALRPATIHRYSAGELAANVMAILDDPSTGWLGPDADLRPGPTETAGAYLRWWSEDVAW